MQATRDLDRRTLLWMSAGGIVGCAVDKKPPAPPASAPPPSAPSRGTGKPGEFDFLTGEWRISHRRLKNPGEWDEFTGEATCWSILGGIASIEELRIPARDFAGMGLRLLDVEHGTWNDFWINAKSGVLGPAGVPGSFVDGVGTFTSSEIDGTTPILVRGTWDRITATSCRWSQAVSRDDGRTWDDNWLMDWVRAS